MQELERLGDERGRPKSVWVETISWRVTALPARFRVVRITGEVTAYFISVRVIDFDLYVNQQLKLKRFYFADFRFRRLRIPLAGFSKMTYGWGCCIFCG